MSARDRVLAVILALGALGTVAACGTPRPPVEVAGCEAVGFTSGRCSLVVEAAAARLAPFHPEITTVVLLPPTDRQLDLSGRRVIVANVAFTFADGTSAQVALDCLADAALPACTVP